jgi:hypothetical protein
MKQKHSHYPPIAAPIAAYDLLVALANIKKSASEQTFSAAC